MFEVTQTFQVGDLSKVAVLVVLEALLSADNALILAIIVRHLPREQQKRALFYGLAGAFVLRFAAIFAATIILNFWWLQVLGAGYLIYLPVKHFIKHSQDKGSVAKEGAGFWWTVIYADLIDLMFAIDSVLVAVAVVNTKEKIWVVYAGAFIGIVLLRFAAGFCLRLLEKYPVLDHVAYLLVGWAGVKMFFIGGHAFDLWFEMRFKEPPPILIPEMPAAVFWGGMALIILVGGFLAIRKPAEVEAETTLEPTDAEPSDTR